MGGNQSDGSDVKDKIAAIFSGEPIIPVLLGRTKEQMAIKAEARKEQIKNELDALKDASSRGDVGTMNTLIPALVQKGALTKEAGEAHWMGALDNMSGREVLKGITDMLANAFKSGQLGPGGPQKGSEGSSGFSNSPAGVNVQPQAQTKATGLPSSLDQVPFIDTFKKYAQQYNVPLPTALALGHAESDGFNPNATSPTGVQGIMQVTKDTMRRNGIDPAINDRTNPEVSINAGIKELARLRDEQGINLNDMNQVVMGYTTPAGGANSKYINKVSNLHQHYSGLVGQGQEQPQSPFPLVQQFPDMGNMPPTQQFVLDNVARTLQVGMDDKGKMSIKFNPLATPTVDEQTSKLLSSLPPEQRNALLMGALAVKAGQGEVREMKVDENTGFMNMMVYNPVDKTTKVIPLWKTNQTPQEKANLEVGTAERKSTAEVVGKEAGQSKIQQSQTQRENIKAQETLQMPDKEFITKMGNQVGIATRVGEGFNSLKSFTGVDGQGKIVVDNLPVGPIDAVQQKFQKYGIGNENVGIMRERLGAMNTDIKSLMYEMGGKQLSDKELEAFTSLDQAIDQSPHIYATRLTDVLDMLEKKMEGQRIVMKASNFDTRALDAAIERIRGVNTGVLNSLPDKYNKILKPKISSTDDMDIDFNRLVGGKK